MDKTLVPDVIKTGFQAKYPSDYVITGFKKDNIGYCTYFIQHINQRKLTEFTPSGVFVSEELILTMMAILRTQPVTQVQKELWFVNVKYRKRFDQINNMLQV